MTVRTALYVALGLMLSAPGCGDDPPASSSKKPVEVEPGEAIEQTNELGPVTAKVTLTPNQPRLGDTLTLTIEVRAEPGVSVEMPSFGEALGRFQIVGFVPRERDDASGYVASQTYTLQAPMSGKQRIPPLRIEFVDERPGQASGARATTAQELLTDEIAIAIASVVPEGAVTDELSEPRGGLDASREASFVGSPAFWVLIAVLVAIAGVIGVMGWRSAAREKTRISAYDVAMTRLDKLERRGLPVADDVDDWYVELSAIIRRYLEDRYGLRAPELTTEEFLNVARHSGHISTSHRELLSVFLAGCDRVKFGRYEPADEESQESLASARTFLEDTRLVERTRGRPAGASDRDARNTA